MDARIVDFFEEDALAKALANADQSLAVSKELA